MCLFDARLPNDEFGKFKLECNAAIDSLLCLRFWDELPPYGILHVIYCALDLHMRRRRCKHGVHPIVLGHPKYPKGQYDHAGTCDCKGHSWATHRFSISPKMLLSLLCLAASCELSFTNRPLRAHVAAQADISASRPCVTVSVFIDRRTGSNCQFFCFFLIHCEELLRSG